MDFCYNVTFKTGWPWEQETIYNIIFIEISKLRGEERLIGSKIMGLGDVQRAEEVSGSESLQSARCRQRCLLCCHWLSRSRWVTRITAESTRRRRSACWCFQRPRSKTSCLLDSTLTANNYGLNHRNQYVSHIFWKLRTCSLTWSYPG